MDIFLFKDNFFENFLSTQCHTFLRQFQFLGKHLCKSMDFSAASYDKAGTDGLIAIQFYNLSGNLRCNLIYRRLHKIPDFLGRNCMGNAHDIFICHFLFCRRCKLHRLCRLKIHKEMLYNQFRQLISRIWNHSIRNNTSFSRHRNIGSSSSHINQCNI